MPWQLTVGRLRQALRHAPGEAVIALRVPADGLSGGGTVGPVFYNLRVEYAGGVIVQLVPLSAPSPGDARSGAGRQAVARPSGLRSRLASDLVMLVHIDANRIRDWDSFHAVFREAMGFPDFYGANMNAWIDCMTLLDDPGAGMTAQHVRPGGVLALQVDGIDDFALRCPEQYEALVDCSAFVNWRRIERGAPPVLALSFYKAPSVAG